MVSDIADEHDRRGRAAQGDRKASRYTTLDTRAGGRYRLRCLGICCRKDGDRTSVPKGGVGEKGGGGDEPMVVLQEEALVKRAGR